MIVVLLFPIPKLLLVEDDTLNHLQETYEKVCEAFRPVTKEHIEVYGEYNEQRLTGLHETASINDFSFGISDRGASIRIPIITVENGWKGWLEDRRPASNGDPYKIAGRIIKTVKTAKVQSINNGLLITLSFCF